jgi:hypothetical protein
MSSVNRNSLTMTLPVCILFVSSSCLIAVARNFRNILHRSGEVGNTCHIVDYRWNGFSFSLLSVMLAIDLSYTFFIILRYFSSLPTFLRAYIMKWCWILSKALPASFEMIKWFLSYINVLYYIYWFAFVELSLHSWDEAELVTVNDLSYMLLKLVCHYFIEDVWINVH